MLMQSNKGHTWYVKPSHILYKQTWCSVCSKAAQHDPQCRNSSGEEYIISYLENKQISYQPQVIINELPRKKYDFVVTYKNTNFIIEFDGLRSADRRPASCACW